MTYLKFQVYNIVIQKFYILYTIWSYIIGYIPCAAHYILVTFILYLPIPHPYIAPPPTHWQPLVCSLHLRDCFFIVIFTSLLYFLDSTYEWYHTLFVFLWLTLPSKSIHIAANGKIRSFLWLSNIPLFNSTSSLSIHLSMDT